MILCDACGKKSEHPDYFPKDVNVNMHRSHEGGGVKLWGGNLCKGCAFVFAENIKASIQEFLKERLALDV